MTYSIVGRDPATGQLGIAAQSHAFAVGRLVHHVEPGVGAVASQAMSLYAHGTRSLAAMAAGSRPTTALADSLARDDQASHRQVTAIAADGTTAAHTGADCLRFAGHHEGRDFVVAGNILQDADVLAAMVDAARDQWQAADSPGSGAAGDQHDTGGGGGAPTLARRMLAVLEAAEEAGGDQRGRQSATMVVVGETDTGEPLLDRPVDIRVDDSADPLAELARLLDLAEAHAAMEVAEHALLEGDLDTARATYAATLPRMGDNLEFHVWAAATFAGAGHLDEAGELVTTLASAPDRDRWEELTRRLAERGMVPTDVVDDWWT